MTYINGHSSVDNRFAHIRTRKTIWAVPSIHGQFDALTKIHDRIFNEFKAGDILIYLGNYTGYSQQSSLTIDEILAFRRSIMTIRGVMPKDIIYLRGAQEEMMQKLMQIQFAPNPRAVLEWMLSNGMAQTLESYGVCIETLKRTAGNGVIALSRWTNYLRSTIRNRSGHDIFAQHLRRAALIHDYTTNETHSQPSQHTYARKNMDMPVNMAAPTSYGQHTHNGTCQIPTTPPSPASMDEKSALASPAMALFVSGGIDFSKSLDEQGDALWWGKDDFTSRVAPYDPFAKVFRGYDRDHKGLHLNCVTATLDNNCGFDGQLICAQIAADTSISDILEA